MSKISVIIIHILLLASPLFLYSQVPELLPAHSVAADSNSISSASNNEKRVGFIPKKISSGLQIGSYFNTTAGYGSGFTTYVSPYISYPVNSRFKVNAGITILNSTYYGTKPIYFNGQESSMNGNFTNGMVYVSGEYLVNDRLSVSGTLFKEFNILSSNPSKDQFYPDYNAQGAFMKVGYKVFDNFHIEAGFGYSKGVSPFNSYWGSPLYYDPFNR